MSETIKLFQYNTLSALFAGLYGGTLKIKDLLQYGDHGIGTLNAIDGELIVIDGKAYQTKSENGQVQVIEVDPNEKVPYAAVVPHQTEVMFNQYDPINDQDLVKKMESFYDGENLFRSIKIKGHFSNMRVRMIPKSETNTKFAEVANNQPEHSATDISGTIVGIWTPKIFHGISVAGYHLHFISDDLSFGGHIMDYTLEYGQIELGAVDQLDQRFPVQDRNYLHAKLDLEALRNDIDKSE